MARLAAGARKRKDGVLEKRFSIDGQRYSVYGRTSDELQEKEQEIRQKIDQRVQISKARITLAQYYAEWQEGRARTVKPSTQYTQNRQFKHIQDDAIGKMRLRDIEPAHIKAFRNALMKKKKKDGELLLTTRGVNLIMSLLKTVFADAVRDRIIPFNPCDSIRPLKPDDNEQDATEGIHRALSSQETDVFFKYAEGSFYLHFFRFLMATGVRSGEAAALQWKDIDQVNGVIHITKTVTRVSDKKVTIGKPKTRKSKRDIPLTDPVKKILADQREQQQMLFPTVKGLDARIFFNTSGEIVRTYSVSSVIKGLVKKANAHGDLLEPFGAHAFRSTYATRAIEAGMHPQTLKEILGHESFKMTMDKYSQVTTERMKEQAAKVAEKMA